MRKKTTLKDIACFSKGSQINGDLLLDEGKYEYLNGGTKASGTWNEFNVNGKTITISEGGNSCGYVNFMKEKFWCGAHCYYLFDVKCKPKYLYYLLKGNQTNLMKLRSGACMPNIKKSDLGNFKFVYDNDMIHQNKIISIFDDLTNVINFYEKQMKYLDNLVKARFVEMFCHKGYTVLEWNDVFNTRTGKLDSNAATENGKYPFFTCSKDILYIDDFDFDQEALLLAGNNAAGKYDVKYYKGKFNAYQRTYVLTLRGNWSYQLFRYQLEDKLEYLRQQSLGGLTKYLTMKILGELSFIIPPIEKQKEFELFVQQVDKSRFDIKKSIIELEREVVYD